MPSTSPPKTDSISSTSSNVINPLTIPTLNESNSSNSSSAYNLDNAEESPTAATSSQPLQGTPAFTSRTLQKGVGTSYTIRKLNRPVTNPSPSNALPPPPPPPPSAIAPSAPLSTSVPPSSSSPPLPVPAFPALHLTPLNDTFVPKQIALSPIGSKIKIGRQTNAKTIPNGANGYFDSKVLSRMHAEVWSEQGKVWIKDVKSSNGTFINGERLSAEAAESEPWELHTSDVVEFGIDIVSDDNKTIVHHKVAAKVHLVLNADDAVDSSREFNNWYRIAGEAPVHRRPIKPTNNVASNGLSFEHVLNRLQGELQKSRDTGSNLGDVSATLNEVQDTLGGGAPPALPNSTHPSRVPPYIPNLQKDAHTQSIAALQSQLNDTQNSLAGHVGKMRDLEGLLAEHDGIKREVGGLRKQIEDAMDSMSRGNGREGGNAGSIHGGRGRNDGRESPIAALLEAEEEADEDDSRSISSVDTIRLNTAEQLARVNGSSARFHTNGTIPQLNDDSERELLLQEQNTKLLTRLEALSVELDEATKLGQSLQSQHAEASSTIKALESKVISLEKAVEGRITEVSSQVLQEAETQWNGWKVAFEESYKQERLSWDVEREKLNKVVKDWEEERKASELKRLAEWEEGDSSAEDSTSIDAASHPEGGSNGSTGSKSSHSNNGKGKSNPSRRKRRSSSSTSGTTVSKLLAASTSSSITTPSDSDSTIGSATGKKRTSNDEWVDSSKNESHKVGRHSHNRSGFDGRVESGIASQALPYASAGAVVLIGVAAAWAITLKMKE